MKLLPPRVKNPSGGQWIGLAVGGVGGYFVGGLIGGMGAIAVAAASAPSPSMSQPDQDAAVKAMTIRAALVSLGASVVGTVAGAALGYHVGS